MNKGQQRKSAQNLRAMFFPAPGIPQFLVFIGRK
jgi:hypothetical protein